MNRLRANTLKDHQNFLLHLGLTAGVSAGAFFALGFPPVLGCIAIGAGLFVNNSLKSKIMRAFQQAVNEERHGDLEDEPTSNHIRRSLKHRDYYKVVLPTMPKATAWIRDFSDRFGFDEAPVLSILQKRKPIPEKDVKSIKDSLRNMLREEFNKSSNAFAFRHLHGNVVLNAPIIRNMNDSELKGVVAHEVGHLAANHMRQRDFTSFFSTPANILVSLNYVFTAFSSFKNAGLVFLGAAAGRTIANGVAKAMDWDPEDKRDKLKMGRVRSLAYIATTASLATFFGAPDLLVALGLNFATKTALNLIGKSHSRCNEYQADRLAAQVTGDPEGMIDALRALQREYFKQNPANQNKPKDALSKAFSKAGELFSTHPTVDHRCKALSGMNEHKQKIHGQDLDFGMKLVV